jgi:hypothetical protein
MASRKITELTALTAPVGSDVLPVIDVSEALPIDQNKKITLTNLTQGLGAATTSVAGIVQLNDTVASTSTTLAATANAVKTTYDLANAALPKSGGTMTGVVTFDAAQPRMVQATVQNSTSGTVLNFTGIPTWAGKITVMLSGVSTSGSSSVIVQLGSTTFTTSGYLGSSNIIGTAGAVTNLSTGFRIFFNTSDAAAAVRHGAMVLSNITGNTWVASGTFGLSDSAWISTIGGTIALGGVLDRVRITTVNGTDTFDAGSVNIIYEG